MAGRRQKGNGRRIFLALRGEIKAEIGAGAFAKAVHAKYEHRLGIGYRQFLKYVKRYGLLASDPGSAEPAPAIPVGCDEPVQSPTLRTAASPISQREPLNARRPEPRRFIFDPTDIDLTKLI